MTSWLNRQDQIPTPLVSDQSMHRQELSAPPAPSTLFSINVTPASVRVSLNYNTSLAVPRHVFRITYADLD